jgi:lipopolysaccharide/colanic/teichoic acid biosynthesis glycosyltransferase
MTPARFLSNALKRGFDLVAASLMLLGFGPLLLAAAVAIRMDSPGPVLFRQTRLGLRGKTFSIFKFRTMQDGSTHLGTGLETHRGDFRITRVGAILRNTRLDELPQLLNVLTGEMSLVGPRPLLPEFLPYYTQWDRWRLEALPGMTGWQQVNGAARHSWSERVHLDIWYVDNRNFLLDIWILFRTIAVVVKADSVYAEDGSQRSGVPDGCPAGGPPRSEP